VRTDSKKHTAKIRVVTLGGEATATRRSRADSLLEGLLSKLTDGTDSVLAAEVDGLVGAGHRAYARPNRTQIAVRR